MIRKLLSVVADATFQAPVNSLPYPNPFTRPETSHFAWLAHHSPCFPINAANVTILHEPSQFYNTLVSLSNSASDRITLASLYLGNGDLERKLVDAILTNDRLTDLEVNVLLDYSRGSRPPNSSREMMLPLLRSKNKPKDCNISFYHTPELRGYYKKYIPNRWNELIGTQHMKLYIFDDTIVMSGANLSNDYFTNRQDRYFVIKDKQLCDFYCGLVKRVQRFSLRINENNDVSLSNDWNQLPYEGDKGNFIQKAGDFIESYMYESRDEQNVHKNEGFDTWIFPMIQMGQLGIEQESCITDRMLAEAPKGAKMKIATAYFNLTKDYINTLIRRSNADCDLLLAHPKANGFLGAKGMAGGIPDSYTLIARQFKDRLIYYGQQNRFKLYEFFRDGWTFHAKGLWYYAPGASHPCLTLIGSSNFSERSVYKDIESQIAIVTENPKLQKNLHSECTTLYECGSKDDVKRSIRLWVHAMVFFFRNFF